MASAIDLTTVSAVNSWLNQASNTDSALIQSAITNLSAKILNWTGRKSLSGVATFTERYDGNGRDSLLLRNYPIISVSSLTIGGTAILPTPDYIQQGYCIDDQGEQNTLRLIGGGSSVWSPYLGWGYGEQGTPSTYCNGLVFARGIMNVAVIYTAGYTQNAIAEQQTIPASGPYTVTSANASTWISDNGIVGFTLVASSPGPFQYTAAAGIYTFNAANAGTVVYLNYVYGAPPLDLQQALTVLVADNYRSRQWIAQTQVNQPGVGTTSYSKLSIPPQTQDTIELYKRRFVV